MIPLHRPAALLLALLLACPAARAAVVARSGAGLPGAPALIRVQGGDIGASAAAAAARRATGGRVLGVSPRRAGGRVIYRVKVLLPDGRVRSVTVDGSSGEVR